MKTILVLTGGSETDASVFATAFTAARPLEAHLDFLHIRVSPGRAAGFRPHLEYAQGAALRDALQALQAEATARSAAAALHFRQFCEEQAIVLAGAPGGSRVSASWCEELDDSVEQTLEHARHHDLIVLGRPSRANGLPPTLIELLLLRCGRPLLLAPPRAPDAITGTALVCWKESPAAARALGAALPLLEKSRQVVIVGVEEPGAPSVDGLREVARQLAWHGISARVGWMPAKGREIAERLDAAGAEFSADLMVMGAYGHGPVRERIFGGCTQHFIDHAERPVLLMH